MLLVFFDGGVGVLEFKVVVVEVGVISFLHFPVGVEICGEGEQEDRACRRIDNNFCEV